MAKVASKSLNFTFNAVALEDDMSSSSLRVTQETPDVTSFADAGPRIVVGNYDYSVDLAGAADFAAGQSDATLATNVLGGASAAFGWDPTGAVAGASDPHYDSTAASVNSYTLTANIGGAITYSASIKGGSALARTVA